MSNKVYTIYVKCKPFNFDSVPIELSENILFDYRTIKDNDYIVYSDYADGKSVKEDLSNPEAEHPFSLNEKNIICIDGEEMIRLVKE